MNRNYKGAIFASALVLMTFGISTESRSQKLSRMDSIHNGRPDERATNVSAEAKRRLLADPKRNLRPFVQSLVSGIDDPFRRVKIIHDWIALNIAYDVDAHAGKSPGASNDYETITMGRGACEMYSSLFKTMTGMAGIETKNILGNIRGSWFNPWKSGDAAHVWNAVRVGGNWFITDVTGDAGGLVGNKFVFHYKTTFLLASPHSAIGFYFPSNPEEQFLSPPLSLPEFSDHFYHTPDFFEWLTPRQPISRIMTVESSLKLSFNLKRPKSSLRAFLKTADGKNAGGARTDIDGTTASVLALFPAPGKYVLEFHMDDQGAGLDSMIGNIGIEAKKKSEERIPIIDYYSWKSNYRIISPVTYRAGQDFTIKVDLPGVPKIVVDHAGWKEYTPTQGSIFEIRIPAMQPGKKFTLWVPGEKKGHLNGGLYFSAE